MPKDNLLTQVDSLLKLPGQIKNTADSQYTNYDLKTKLKVRQNQLNPRYGQSKKSVPRKNIGAPKKNPPFNKRKVASAANKMFK